jgi:AraC-like DNA-binding protein
MQVTNLTARNLAQGGFIHAGQHHGLPARNRHLIWRQWCAFLVVAGNAFYTDSHGRRYRLHPGMVVQHLPGQSHRILRHQPEEWCEWSVRVDGQTASHLFALGIIDQRPVFPVQGGLSAGQQHFMAFQESLRDETQTPSECLIALQQLCCAWPERAQDTVEQDRLRLAAERLNADQKASIDLEQLALSLGWSYPHFRRLFQQRFHCGPAAWRNHARLDVAQRLLRSDDPPIVASVADALGFSEPAVFSRAYKNHFGVAPSQDVS